MPGGAQALNNPATREAAKKSFVASLKSALKGGAEEISQEAIDGGFNHIASEMNKGKTFQEAATSYAEQFPQSALTSALLGGGVQAMADKKNGGASPPRQQPVTPQQSAQVNPPAPSPQQHIPHSTTTDAPASASGSGQQSSASAHNSQPQQPAPANPPVPSPQQTIPQTATVDAQATGSIQPPQAPPAPPLPPPTTAPKSPEQSQQLINNVMNRPPEQRGHPQVQSDLAQAQSVLQDHVQKLENQTEPLSNAQKKELADARATLSRLPAEKPANTPGNTRPPESADRPQPETPDSATRPHGEADPHTRPATADPSRAPHADTAAEAPRSRPDSDGWTPHADTRPNDARPGRKLPADAEPPPRGHGSPDSPQSGKNIPDGRPLEPSYPTPERNSSTAGNDADTTPYHPATSADSANATTPKTADRPASRNAPDQVQNTTSSPSPRPTDNSRPPAPNTPATPPAATANGSQPSSPSRTSLPPPRTPPLSPEQSRRLLDNVAKMPEKAQQHPQVQADVAQAQSVVAGDAARSPGNNQALPQSDSHVAGTLADGTPASGTQHPDSEPLQARWKPSGLHPLNIDSKAAEKWRAELKAQMKTNPVSIHEVVSSWSATSPELTLSQHKVYSAAQTLLDMLPPDLAKNLRPIEFKVHSELLNGEPAHYLPESNAIALSQKVLKNATPEELRGYLWHELGHWMYFNAHRDPRVFRWRAAIDQHWRKRTQGKPIKKNSQGIQFVEGGWISDYAGKKYRGRTGGIELPSVYLEEASKGPEKLAKLCRTYPLSKETFDIVLSIFSNARP